ncbi:hypothetical protein [Sphingomonas montanisoli]|uniref:Uncharacterized protein n=1 Tax=Sphingomonas montanisoli TaxID=2606412 RepID=A0A5D9C2W6_9SPHN|nr:hypothetical protein [Sphingomonas montanisoli]TZG25607.1 hypothetical protein FYJ91_11315 [Sphingomonas montanisoli]
MIALAITYAFTAPLVALLLGKLMSHDGIHKSQALASHRHRDLLTADCSILAPRLDQQDAPLGHDDQAASVSHHGASSK